MTILRTETEIQMEADNIAQQVLTLQSMKRLMPSCIYIRRMIRLSSILDTLRWLNGDIDAPESSELGGGK